MDHALVCLLDLGPLRLDQSPSLARDIQVDHALKPGSRGILASLAGGDDGLGTASGNGGFQVHPTAKDSPGYASTVGWLLATQPHGLILEGFDKSRPFFRILGENRGKAGVTYVLRRCSVAELTVFRDGGEIMQML